MLGNSITHIHTRARQQNHKTNRIYLSFLPLFLLYFSVLCCIYAHHIKIYIFFCVLCSRVELFNITRKCYFKNGQHHFLYMDLIKQIISKYISYHILSFTLMMKQYLYVHVWWTQMLYVYIYSLNVSKQNNNIHYVI